MIEGGAGDADEDDHDAEVDDVAAVAARVAAREQDHAGKDVLAGLSADDVGAAQKLGRNGGDDAGGEREGNQRIEAWPDRSRGEALPRCRTIAVVTMAAAGRMKLRRMLLKDALRQASSGPTPVRKSRNRPMGMATRL